MSTPPRPVSLPWPGWRIALGAVARGAALWTLVRALVGVAPAILWPTLVILVVTVVAALADAHARRLSTFLGNLGISMGVVVAFWLLPIALLELGLLLSGVEIGGLPGGLLGGMP